MSSELPNVHSVDENIRERLAFQRLSAWFSDMNHSRLVLEWQHLHVGNGSVNSRNPPLALVLVDGVL